MSPILQSFASADAWGGGGGGGGRKQSGFWELGQSSYPRSVLAVRAGAGRKGSDAQCETPGASSHSHSVCVPQAERRCPFF